MKRKILYISGTRADYGLMKSVFKRIHEEPGLELEIIATGMHLMEEFGYTIDDIRKDGYNIHTIDAIFENDDRDSMALFTGRLIQQLVPVIRQISPDIILILGDRGEMLAGAIMGVYLGIPVAHLHGGEVSSTVDDTVRHAITKLTHIHFPATWNSARRIIRMGEDPTRVFVVGAPAIDYLKHGYLIDQEIISKKYQVSLRDDLLIVLQHPVSDESDKAAFQMNETMKAIVKSHRQTIVIYPNADAGGRAMIEVIKRYSALPFLKIYKNIPHQDFVSLLQVASILIGNSSSGIIEAPTFALPVINIGTRQKGRERGKNVTDAGYDEREIKTAIDTVLNNAYLKQELKSYSNPYGDGNCSVKVTEILKTIPIDTETLQKRMVY